MEKKHNPKLAALLQLRKMVEELINDDFQSDKMPKLMALKVKMTPESPMVDEMAPDESLEHEMAEGETPSLSEAIQSAAESPDSELGTEADEESEEVCPECGEMGCDCEGMDKKPLVKAVAIKASTVESPQVAKLKKLLGK